MPLTMRAEMREFLETNPAPNGWTIGGESRLMGQLALQRTDLNMEMRFLKERRRTNSECRRSGSTTGRMPTPTRPSLGQGRSSACQ